jgi:hypothetical protein
MKILTAKKVREAVIVEAEGGTVVLLGKQYLMGAGVVYVRAAGLQLTPVTVPASPGYGELKVEPGTTDPQLLCLARRGYMLAEVGDWSADKQEIEMDVPTEAEALTELFSGKDIFGGSWPSPKLPLNVAEWAGGPMIGRASAPLSGALRNFVETSKWTFAKTMPEWPHEYLVRDRVDRELFEALVVHIRTCGFEAPFYQSVLTYFAEDGFLYWTMGSPLEETTIINRCKEEGSYENRLRNGTLPERRAVESQVRQDPPSHADKDSETRQKSAELYYLDNSGIKRDAELHNEMLDTPAGNIASEYAAMKQAMDRGMTLKEAAALYASPETLKWLNGNGGFGSE